MEAIISLLSFTLLLLVILIVLIIVYSHNRSSNKYYHPRVKEDLKRIKKQIIA